MKRSAAAVAAGPSDSHVTSAHPADREGSGARSWRAVTRPTPDSWSEALKRTVAVGEPSQDCRTGEWMVRAGAEVSGLTRMVLTWRNPTPSTDLTEKDDAAEVRPKSKLRDRVAVRVSGSSVVAPGEPASQPAPATCPTLSETMPDCGSRPVMLIVKATRSAAPVPHGRPAGRGITGSRDRRSERRRRVCPDSTRPLDRRVAGLVGGSQDPLVAAPVTRVRRPHTGRSP